MIHIMEQLLPSQPRGISEMVASLKDFHMTKKFSDVTLQNAVVNASYAAVIESELPSEMIFQAMGGGDQSPLAGYLGTYMAGLQEYMLKAKNIAVDGVK
ncbi:phage portal protein, partial [Klebsiella pneumoniae]